jgi:hypothetical protein
MTDRETLALADEIFEPVAREQDPLYLVWDDAACFVEQRPAISQEEATLPSPSRRQPLVDPQALRDTEADIDRELDEELLLQERREARLQLLARTWKLLALLALLAVPVPAFYGWSYYSLALMDRPLHGLHPLLRPSGLVGLTAGLVGTLLILASTAYVIRKQLTRWLGVRSLQSWMSFHVLAGLLGPAVIVLHTSFRPTSALGGLALLAMLIVVASGLLGRYLLVYLPRAAQGGEVGLQAVRRRLAVYRKKLIALGLAADLLRGVGLEGRTSQKPWLITSIARVLYGDRESRRQMRQLQAAVHEQGNLGEEARLVMILVRRMCRERQFLVRYHELRKIIGTWRFLHRWFAVLLLLGALFHIVVALQHGNLWILGGRG